MVARSISSSIFGRCAAATGASSWEIAQGDGAGTVDAEGVNDVGERGPIPQGVRHSIRADDEVGVARIVRFEFQDAAAPAVDGGENLDVVRQQRMQPIDRGELLRQAIVRAVMIGLRTGNAADRFAGADAPEIFLHFSPGQSPEPVLQIDVGHADIVPVHEDKNVAARDIRRIPPKGRRHLRHPGSQADTAMGGSRDATSGSPGSAPRPPAN